MQRQWGAWLIFGCSLQGLDSIFKQATATFMAGLFLAGAVIGDPAPTSA
jgi:hypothetical protein